jgi:hypothetical protein
VWTERNPTPTPAGVSGPGFAQNVSAGYAILYGGWNATTGYSNETWKANRAEWSPLTPVHSPGPLANASLAYDKFSKYLIMFGGSTGSGFSSLTWTWSGADWVKLNPLSSPTARSNASLVEDSADLVMVLFGGTSGGGQYLNDTWIWTGELSATLHGSPKLLLIGNVETYTANVSGGLRPYHYWWLNLPQGCHTRDVNPYNCTPSSLGTNNSRVQVNDSAGRNVTTNYFHLLVTTPNYLSVNLTILPTNHIDLGQAAYFWANATGEPLYYTYNWTQLIPMPPGCFQNDSPVIGCFPTATGRFPVEVDVTDTLGHSRIGFANLTVTSSVSASFSVSPNPDEVGVPVTFNVSVVNGSPPDSYDYLGLPLGCISANESALSCSPTGAGNYSIQTKVTDATGVIVYTTPVELTVVPRLEATLSVSTETVNVGEPVVFTISVVPGLAPYSYHYFSLPSGCNSENAPSLRCSPSAPGVYDVHARVSDALGVTVDTVPFNLTVTGSSPPGCSFGACLFGLPGFQGLVILGAMGAAAVAIVVAFLLIRRGHGPEPRAPGSFDSLTSPAPKEVTSRPTDSENREIPRGHG